MANAKLFLLQMHPDFAPMLKEKLALISSHGPGGGGLALSFWSQHLQALALLLLIFGKWTLRPALQVAPLPGSDHVKAAVVMFTCTFIMSSLLALCIHSGNVRKTGPCFMGFWRVPCLTGAKLLG